MAETRGETGVEDPREAAGATFSEETTDGVRRMTSAADDADPKSDAPKVGPSGVVNAPQNWDPESAAFSAGKLDPYGDNADVLNDTQSGATIGHAVKAGAASGKRGPVADPRG